MIILKPIDQLEDALQQQIRLLRNEPGVRRWMFNSHLISEDEHARWLHSVMRNPRQQVFAVLQGQQPLGVTSLHRLDGAVAEWAFYLGRRAHRGLGAAIEYAFVHYIFSQLQIDRLRCEVLAANRAVRKLHGRFLFAPTGRRWQQVAGGAKPLEVIELELTQARWHRGRQALWRRHASVFEKFPVSIAAD